MTSEGRNVSTGWAAADQGNGLTRLEISHMALRPNHCSSLMAADVIIRQVYLILLCHLRGLRSRESFRNRCCRRGEAIFRQTRSLVMTHAALTFPPLMTFDSFFIRVQTSLCRLPHSRSSIQSERKRSHAASLAAANQATWSCRASRKWCHTLENGCVKVTNIQNQLHFLF